MFLTQKTSIVIHRRKYFLQVQILEKDRLSKMVTRHLTGTRQVK